ASIVRGFDQRLQAGDRVVPLRRDLLQAAAHLVELAGTDAPDALAAAPLVADQPRAGEHAQVLGHRLASQPRAVRQPRNRQRTFAAEPADDLQARLVAERREDRQGPGPAGGALLARHGGAVRPTAPGTGR